MRKTARLSSAIVCSLITVFALNGLIAGQTPASSASHPVSDPALQRLEREIARLSAVSGGVVGVTAIHLETGRRVSMNSAERFPMASTFKVPIAVQLLTRIDKGEVKLDQMIDIKQSDLHPGSGTLADLFNKGGLALSVRNLMELMLLISDNNATDVMLRTAGGAEAVTARMRALGIEGVNVNRSTAQLIADWIGATDLPPEDRWNPTVFSVAFNVCEVIGQGSIRSRTSNSGDRPRRPRLLSVPASSFFMREPAAKVRLPRLYCALWLVQSVRDWSRTRAAGAQFGAYR